MAVHLVNFLPKYRVHTVYITMIYNWIWTTLCTRPLYIYIWLWPPLCLAAPMYAEYVGLARTVHLHRI